MKISLNGTFEGLDGEVMKEQITDATGKITSTRPITMFDVLRVSVSAEIQGDTEGAAQDVLDRKIKNFDIYLKIREAKFEGEVDLSNEEIVHIKPRISKVYHTLIAGPAVKILEGKDPYGKKRLRTVDSKIVESAPQVAVEKDILDPTAHENLK